MLLKNEHGTYICKDCKGILEYSGEYDTYYCSTCNVWAEERCDDDNCMFCKNRPNKPSEI